MNVPAFDRSALSCAPRDALETSVPFECHDFGVRPELDKGVVFDTSNEIPGHRVGQSVTANQHMDATAPVGQKHGRLTSGVAAADNSNLLAGAHLAFHLGRCVIDP